MSIKLYEGCKLCNLINQDAELWFETHRRIFEERMPRGNVMNWLNARIQERNAVLPVERQIVEFNAQNFQNHFVTDPHLKDMLDIREVCTAGFSLQLRIKKKGKHLVDHKDPPLLAKERHQIIMAEPDEFVRMKALVRAAEHRLHIYNNQMSLREQKAQLGKEEEVIVDLQEVATFQKLITELLKLKEKVAKVEASSKIAGAAVKEAVTLFVEGTLERVNGTSEEIHAMLSREMPGSRLPDQVSNTLRSRIGDQMKLAIPEVIETVYGRFGIK